MSMQAIMVRKMFAKGDARRDEGLTTPEDITRHDNISYGPYGEWNLLDVYYPKETSAPLPTIINIHGGGYVYGTKEVYQFYCMSLAQRGFCVVSFNYRLAPENKFPCPLEDTNRVMEWVCANAAEYYIDLNNIFMVGDSAGAQLNSQYAVIATNPAYAALFDFKVPLFSLRAIGLNCGMYDLADPTLLSEMKGLKTDYFGRDMSVYGEITRVLDYIGKGFPPASITTAENDFLRDKAQPMAELLTSRGVENQVHIYGSKEQKDVSHVFHVKIRLPEATLCNDAQCAFFKKQIQ